MSDAPEPLTVGTAGHVDHGKSALVGALTGSRTDRLPEEQARGMTIALGYASLSLPSGRSLSLIDVPGHERFVRTMVAGATGIDLFLMVIAADDGVMPQTIEHLQVLRVLGVDDGVVAVTKCDLAEPDDALRAARKLMPDATIVACSARTGAGIAQVAAALDRVAADRRSRARDPGSCVLHVDRVFSVRGAGTVLTGTLWSGAVSRGDRLQLLPSGVPVRVRAVQVHDAPRESASAGQRVAVNLTHVPRERVGRGDVLASLDTPLVSTYRFDARVVSDRDLSGRRRVMVHHGTRESPARLVHLGGDFWQVRLERVLVLGAGDRFVVRAISPPGTLGGGVVLDAKAPRHRPAPMLLERLQRLARGEIVAETPPEASAKAHAETEPAQVQELAAAAPSGRARELERRLREAGPRPPTAAELGDYAQHLDELRRAGVAIRVGRSMYAHVETIAQVRATVQRIVDAEGHVTLARLRDELGISRRYAQALLEHMDASRVTLRLADDRRVLRGVGARALT